jgi:hypothetical protein
MRGKMINKTIAKIRTMFLRPPLLVVLILLGVGLDLYAQQKFRPDVDGDYPRSVFIVTNRVINTTADAGIIFTNQVDTAQSLKFLKISFENDEWNGVGYEDFDDLLDNQAPYHDWAVWVHGDGQSFLLSMKRAIEIQYLHKVNLIVFSWPTKAAGKGPVGNFKNSLVNAGLTVPHLGEMCRILQDYRDLDDNRMTNENLSIFFHSLGNYLLKLTIEAGGFQEIRTGLFDNLVINSAATDSEGHHQWIEKLNLQKRIYTIYNGGDKNLRGLRVLTSYGMQLGEYPLPPHARNAIYVDFSMAVGRKYSAGASHSFYYAKVTDLSQNIRQFYMDIFHGREIDLDNPEEFDPRGTRKIFMIRF